MDVLLVPRGKPGQYDLILAGPVEHLAAWMIRFGGGVTRAACVKPDWFCFGVNKTALAYAEEPDEDYTALGLLGTVWGSGKPYDLELTISPPGRQPYALSTVLCRLDVDGNGVVNNSDWVRVHTRRLGQQGGPEKVRGGEGIVNVADLVLVNALKGYGME